MNSELCFTRLKRAQIRERVSAKVDGLPAPSIFAVLSRGQEMRDPETGIGEPGTILKLAPLVRCSPRQKSRVERLKAIVEPLLT